ncbi:creatininase family protein [Actibacterium sp. MT2.3-13A]|uniref:creatininase family protein n=1 Tax=Actibacterium sp. MT2.3-13A TaxID=2828332 RepID=UPI001BA6E305|nr:creatininase family protein [Actibacterium sp. MT2.3-13A]
MSKWYELSEMTSVEFAKAREDIRIALVPVGATEQHGPNLAMGTDYVIAHRFCQRIAAGIHPQAVVVPPVPLGLSYHHMGFPGTLSFSPETFTAVCFDIAKSLKHQGIDHVLFVNGHNGNSAVLNVAVTKIRYDLDMQAAVAFWFQQASDLVREAGQTERFGHACEVETSVLMALQGDMVREHALEPGDMKPVTLKYAFNNQPFFHTVPVPFHEQTGNGVFGDARLASREMGERLVAAAVERTIEFIETFIES